MRSAWAVRPGTAAEGPMAGWNASTDRMIGALQEISNLVGSVMRLEDILNRIVRITADLMGMPACSIYLLNEKGALVLRSNVGFEPELVGNMAFAPGEGIPGWVATENRLLALPDAALDTRFKPMESVMERDYRSYLGAPLRIQEEVIGVLTVRGTSVMQFESRQCLVLETVCKMIAIVIEKGRMYQEMIQARELAAVAVSLSGTAHFIKNVMFTTQVAEATIDKAVHEKAPIEIIGTAWRAMKESNRQIAKMVGNMLNYCRDESPRYERVNVNGLIADIVERLRATADRHAVTIHAELDASLPEAYLDAHLVRDALLNLITNGIDAVPSGRGGGVWVRTYRMDGQNNFRIEVSDNGAGIPAGIRAKVFNLFFSTKGESGSGIGLASTRKVIERHGGTIEFDSTEGAGTRFDVFLPLTPPAGLTSLA